MKYEEFEARAKGAFDDCSEMKRMLWNMQTVVAAVPDMVRKNERLEKEKAELKAEIERLRSEVPDDCMRLPLDADGVAIRIGDESEVDGDAMTVLGYRFRNDMLLIIAKDKESGLVFTPDPSRVRHCKPEPPDSWEKLEEDSLLSVDEYRNLTGIDCNEGAYFAKQRDLIRRAKRLAGVNDD